MPMLILMMMMLMLMQMIMLILIMLSNAIYLPGGGWSRNYPLGVAYGSELQIERRSYAKLKHSRASQLGEAVANRIALVKKRDSSCAPALQTDHD